MKAHRIAANKFPRNTDKPAQHRPFKVSQCSSLNGPLVGPLKATLYVEGTVDFVVFINAPIATVWSKPVPR